MSAAVVGSSFSPKPNRRDSSRDQLTLFVAKSSSQLPIWAMLWTSAAEFSSRFIKMAKRMELTRSRPSSILLEMWLPAPVSIVPMPRPASSLSVRTSIATAGDEPAERHHGSERFGTREPEVDHDAIGPPRLEIRRCLRRGGNPTAISNADGAAFSSISSRRSTSESLLSTRRTIVLLDVASVAWRLSILASVQRQ